MFDRSLPPGTHVHNGAHVQIPYILDTIVIASIASVTIQSVAMAQTTQTTQTTEPIRLGPVTVYIYKDPDDAQKLPVSISLHWRRKNEEPLGSRRLCSGW